MCFDEAVTKCERVDLLFDFFKLADILEPSGPFDSLLAELRGTFVQELDLLRPANVRAAYELPKGHGARKPVAEASVLRYLIFKRGGRDLMYQREMDQFADFGLDLLETLAELFKTAKAFMFSSHKAKMNILCPLSNKWFDYR